VEPNGKATGKTASDKLPWQYGRERMGEGSDLSYIHTRTTSSSYSTEKTLHQCLHKRSALRPSSVPVARRPPPP